MKVWNVCAVVALALSTGVAQTAPPAPGPTTQVIVTAEARKGTPPALQEADIMMYQKKDKLPVSEVTPLAGSPAELFVVVDDAIGDDFGVQIPELQRFITEQPANVSVGVAYMHDAAADIVQKPTTDHAAAAKAIRLTAPGFGTSAFESVTDLLKKWPESHARREMILISAGIEPFGTLDFSNGLVEEAVSAVQRQGIPVFAIYLEASGHWGHTYWLRTWAQTYLSQLSDESGGEGYNMISNTVVTIAPFLNNINQRLQNQYRVTFTPNAPSKPGFVPIRATTEVPKVDLVTQNRVWVGGAE